MADQTADNFQDVTEPAPVVYPPITSDSPWAAVWQLPVLLLGLGLFAMGVWAVLPRHEPPNMEALLDSVGLYLEAENDVAALEKLDIARQHHKLATPMQIGRTWAYYGDLNFLQLSKLLGGPSLSLNESEEVRAARQKIISYYREAENENTGYRLSTKQLGWLAQTLVMMDRDAEAFAAIERLKDGPAEHRYRIVRQMIERKLVAPGGVDYAKIAPLLERFRHEVRSEPDNTKAMEQTVWVTQRNAELWLDADPSKAEEYLWVHIQRLRSLKVTDESLGPLFVILAKAQSRQQAFDDAEENFGIAARMLPRHHALQAEVLVGVARISLARGSEGHAQENGMRQALELFKRTTEQFPSEPAYIDALIGRADVESRLDMHGEAREHFAMAVAALLKHAPAWDPRRRLLSDTIHAHAQVAAEQNALERSLELLTQLRPLYEPNLPQDLVFKFGVTHEMIAQHNHDAAAGVNGQVPSPAARKMYNQEAAIHFGKSAAYFRDYAVLVTQTDDQAHGDALWRAARNFDRAQLWTEAIDTYRQFVNTRMEDNRLLQAKHLLGKAQITNGDYESAAALFNELRRDHPKGRWTYESLVPLARAYAELDQFAAARRILLEATSNHPSITPDSDVYRDALIELGRLYYESGREDPAHYVNAIQTLTEAVLRYGNTEFGASLRYMLADANRRSIVTLDAKLRDQRAQRELIALQAERLRRLEESQIYYNQVITELESRDRETLSPLELTYFRNAYFFQADSAFDRGQYEQAIALYDEAAKHWESDPASLVAHVQIVNAYCELGRYDAAKRANEKALWALERLPDEAFNDPTLPMTRQHWEDWLRWTSEMDLFGAQARVP